MSIANLTIEKVEQEFAAWRVNKKRGVPTPIPGALCDKVKILLKSHPHNSTLRRFGISKEQARKKNLIPPAITIEHNSKYKSLPVNSFIQVPMKQEPMMHAIPPRTTSITFQRGDTQISLNSPSDDQIQFVINTLLR